MDGMPDPSVQAPADPNAPQEKPTLEGLLTTLITEVRGLRADNETLRHEQAELREKVEQGASLAAEGIQHTFDPATSGRRDVARHVTIRTRPVVDDPEHYRDVTDPSPVRWAG